MKLNMESFQVIHKPCCFSSHSSCREEPEEMVMDADVSMSTPSCWKSPVKIMTKLMMMLGGIMMINVGSSLGINNLWNHQRRSTSSGSSKHGTSIWMRRMLITSLICLWLLVSSAQAYPMRDHQSRKYYLSPSLGDNPAAQRSFNPPGESSLSLSIFSPLDILRQNMLLEIQRKRLRHAKQRQVQSNKEYLDRIG